MDLAHILVDCESPGPSIIWAAAEKLWRERESEWPEVSLGSILGCGLAEFRDNGKLRRGAQRLYRILMSESAYTIWLLRNDRVINWAGEPHSETAIINKWLFNMNQRLQLDVTLANRPARGNRPRLGTRLVVDTWSGVLDDENNLPANWLRGTRVLVGRRALTQSQLCLRDGIGVG
ncbi:hypothetical protein C8R45DRAFT_835894 [Mycena sanguinolenta]|nr:hypothetical protein C8R45DRAFT_835894 [Mycena sanguinolenta]